MGKMEEVYVPGEFFSLKKKSFLKRVIFIVTLVVLISL